MGRSHLNAWKLRRSIDKFLTKRLRNLLGCFTGCLYWRYTEGDFLRWRMWSPKSESLPNAGPRGNDEKRCEHSYEAAEI